MSDPASRTDETVAAFIEGVTPERQREEAATLDALFRKLTGWQPVMWPHGIVGYGRYAYRYRSGRTGEWFATGFSPRKARHTVHILPGYADYGEIRARLGKHTMGKSCLYLNKLADIDLDVLAELVTAGLEDLGKEWPVFPA